MRATFISRMATMSKANCLLLYALAILVFISSTVTAITLEQLQNSFNVDMNPEHGGSCGRTLADQPMIPKVLDAFQDAWLLSSLSIRIPPNEIAVRLQNPDQNQDFVRLRSLLFVFFGIKLGRNGQFFALSQRLYNDILSKLTNSIRLSVKLVRMLIRNITGEFSNVASLLTEPVDAFGFGLPKFRCLEDYSEYYEHLADADGVEDPDLPLAAEYFGATCTNPVASIRMRQPTNNLHFQILMVTSYQAFCTIMFTERFTVAPPATLRRTTATWTILSHSRLRSEHKLHRNMGGCIFSKGYLY